MLVTDRDDVRDRVLVLRDHGRRPGDPSFWNAEVAHKYKMSSLQAALGLAQLERIQELLDKKRQIFGWYDERLRDVEGLTLNYEAAGTRSTYWMVTAILDSSHGLTKDRLGATLAARGIDTRPFFHPLSSLPAYRELASARDARPRNDVSYRISPYGVNLPSALCLTEEQVDYVCRTIKEIWAAEQLSQSLLGPLDT